MSDTLRKVLRSRRLGFVPCQEKTLDIGRVYDYRTRANVPCVGLAVSEREMLSCAGDGTLFTLPLDKVTRLRFNGMDVRDLEDSWGVLYSVIRVAFHEERKWRIEKEGGVFPLHDVSVYGKEEKQASDGTVGFCFQDEEEIVE